jgi:hypothetical protein
VYWRRRLIVVMVMLALVLAAVWQTRVNRGDNDAAAPPEGATGTETEGTAEPTGTDRFAAAAVGAAVSADSLATVTGAEAGSPHVRPVFAEPTGRCDPTATTATADVPEPVVSGTGAVLQVRLRTTAASACTLFLTDRLLVQVTRDDEAIWRLQDCPSALSTPSVVLQPAWSTVIDIAWSGRASNAKCGLGTPAADPGNYSLQAAILSGEPGTTDLRVLAPDRPERGGETG